MNAGLPVIIDNIGFAPMKLVGHAHAGRIDCYQLVDNGLNVPNLAS